MAWEEELFGFLDDLEGQAGALYADERDADLMDRSRAEYSVVTLTGRLMASAGARVEIEVRGVGPIRGVLTRVARDWCLVSGHGQDWLVPRHAIAAVAGVSDRAVPEVAWSPLTRLGLDSALRRLADAGERCVVHTLDAGRHEGALVRVGADFVEAMTGERRTVLLSLVAVAAVQRRD